jgi:hypothetical protein
MVQIDWEAILEAPTEKEIEDAGRQIFDIYTNIVVTNKPDAELTTLEMMALSAGESASSQEARNLAELYGAGIQPLKLTDLSALFFKFVQEVLRRFRGPLCVELRENKDIVLLAPTIVTLLSLPVGIAALAVPVSAILSRIGIAALCQDVEAAAEDVNFLADLIKLHADNLRYLETERARQIPGNVSANLDQAIAFEEQRIRSLNEEQRKRRP